MPTSTPNRGARCSDLSSGPSTARWPDSGSVGSIPVVRRIAAADSALTRPAPAWAPAGGNLATTRSSSPSSNRSTSADRCAAVSARSASANRYHPASGWASTASPRAAPLPRLIGRTSTSAPAASARAAVSSVEPSSTTTTRVTPSMFDSAAIVAAIAGEFLAGTTAIPEAGPSTGSRGAAVSRSVLTRRALHRGRRQSYRV